MFAVLHTKSHYSVGYGTAFIDEFVRRAAELGYSAVALTDVENLYGQVQFHHAARHWGVRPIAGVELRAEFGPRKLGQKTGRLVLLARDRPGYESLCRIISLRRRGGPFQTGSPLQCLDVQPRDLFYLSDDASVLLALRQAGVSLADLRFLLVRPGTGSPPPEIRPLADPDVVMLDPSDRELHRLQLAIRRRQTMGTVSDAEPGERSLPAPALLRALYQDIPEALAETLNVAEACSLDLRNAPIRLPCLHLPPGLNAEDRVEQICRECLAREYGNSPLYSERLTREIPVLRQRGFGAYLLTVAEIIEGARHLGIAVAGRGSAAGSLVAYLLGLTGIDPIVHGLSFERFVHVQRHDLPDIDLDLPSNRRDELIHWVFQHFGPEKVAMVSVHQTFGQRAAFREGLKALGMPLAEVNTFCEHMPSEELQDTLPVPVQRLSARYRRAVPLILRLVGKFQHLSVHPGGLVIAEPRIERFAPLERAPKGMPVTQYDMHSVAKVGLLKIDLLGNRALSAVEETLGLIGRVPMPDHDPATLQTLSAGQTLGCFQIETPAMRLVLKRLPILGIKDVRAALAIVRPGPASGQAKAAFIRRARGEEPASPPHPLLAESLEDTYGMMLFEEDLMTAISMLTGCPPDKADAFRSAILAAQEDAEESASLESAFIAAAESTGVLRTEAAEVWRTLARFAAYSFNKAHATSYAQLAWQTAYLKTHHPAAFACAVLNSYGGSYPLRTLAADFARRQVRLLGPDVNASGLSCVLEAGAVRIGLSPVKHLRIRTRQEILARRPFTDLRDFLGRVPLGFRELEALILCGACDGLAPLSPAGYPADHQEALRCLSTHFRPDALADFVPRQLVGPHAEAYRALMRVHQELNYLGMHVSDHPLRVLRDEAVRAGCITTADLPCRVGQSVRLAALIAASKRLPTSDGKIMQFVTLEDEVGLVEALLFPGNYTRLGDPFTSPGPFLISGTVYEEQGDISLHVSEAIPFYRRAQPFGSD